MCVEIVACDLLEGLQVKYGTPNRSTRQALAGGDVHLATIEDTRKRFLEQVRPVEGLVALLDERHLLGLQLRHVPGILLQGEAGVLQFLGFRSARLFAHLCATDLVECVVG